MKKNQKDKFLLNLPVKAEIGDIVLYRGFVEGEEVEIEAEIIDETAFDYITHLNKYGIKTGFHKSRLIKILKSKSGQTQLFN